MRALALLVATGCTAASPELGLDALVQVRDAQFRPGPFPRDEGGPATVTLLAGGSVYRGGLPTPVRGVLDLDATAVAIGAAGVDGTWIVPASGVEIDSPDNANARASVGIARDFPLGTFTLLMAAANDDGRFGPLATAELIAADAPVPDGELVIGLYWSSTADLDIHVVDPLGGEAYSRDPNTYPDPRPGEPVDPTAYLAGGILDHDGNKDCHRDGAPAEHVVWQMPPPSGEYIVRVDARTMCSDASAAWEVRAYRGGELLGTARGIALPDDVLQPHGDGAGVLALRFSL